MFHYRIDLVITAGAHARSTDSMQLACASRLPGEICALVLCAKEEVVRGVRHESLVTHIARYRATGSRSQSTDRVQALDVSGLGQKFATGWPFQIPNRLQQQARDRTTMRAARVRTGTNKIDLLGPHLAAVKGTLPGRVAERHWC